MATNPGPLLAIDAASPRSSVAVGLDGRLLAAVDAPGGPGARPLLALVDEAMRLAALSPRDLAHLVAVRGPGSFTGVRLALATAWALHEALDCPASSVTTFEALAWQGVGGPERILALVDALRGEWYCQLLAVDRPPMAISEARILSGEELRRLPPGSAIGFGVSALARELPDQQLLEAQPLAGPLAIALSLAPTTSDPGRLLTPLYLRAPTPEVRLAKGPSPGPPGA